MSLNKIPVLDKGYVALFSSSMSNRELIDAKDLLFRGRRDGRLLSLPQVHVVIKSPIFMQLSFSSTSIRTLNSSDRTREAYIPTVNEVGARDLESSELIQRDIEQTTEALLLNPKSYQMDGCDVYVAQSITPISVYNTYLATGSLADWISYINRDDYPMPVKQYCKAIRDILLAEWPSLREEIDGKKEKRKG